jgi:hypothetical protein
VTSPGKTQASDNGQLAASGVLFHLPTSLKAYGDFAGYDFGSEVGLLRYVVDFVNRKPEPYKHGTTQLRPVGRERLHQLLRVAVHGPSLPDDLDLRNPTDGAIENISQRTGHVRWEHRLERTPAGVELRHHAHILDADSFYWLIVILLMKPANRAAISQCGHTGCPEFFIVAKTAGRPQLYHNEECAKAANAATADERQRNLRKRRAAIVMLKGSTASKARIQDAIKQAFSHHSDATAEQLAAHARVLLKSGPKRT